MVPLGGYWEGHCLLFTEPSGRSQEGLFHSLRCLYVHVCIYMYIYVFECVYIYLCMHVYMYVCIYA